MHRQFGQENMHSTHALNSSSTRHATSQNVSHGDLAATNSGLPCRVAQCVGRRFRRHCIAVPGSSGDCLAGSTAGCFAASRLPSELQATAAPQQDWGRNGSSLCWLPRRLARWTQRPCRSRHLRNMQNKVCWQLSFGGGSPR